LPARDYAVLIEMVRRPELTASFIRRRMERRGFVLHPGTFRRSVAELRRREGIRVRPRRPRKTSLALERADESGGLAITITINGSVKAAAQVLRAIADAAMEGRV
jgi:hypothetical protein